MKQEPNSRRAVSTDAREGILHLQAGEDVNNQTALRDRIADALVSWTYRGKEPDPGIGMLETVRANAYSRADAVLAVLPAPVDRAAVLLEAADELAALRPCDECDPGRHDAIERLRRRAAETPHAGTPDEALHCVCGDPVQLMDDSDPSSWIHSPGSDTRCLEARPRCPHCQMPHMLTPGMALACASIRASIADHAPAVVAQPGKETDTGAPATTKPEEGTRTADPLTGSATEYRVPVPEGGGTNLIVRRQGVAFGAGWSVAVPGWGGGRAWTAEGWQDSISALSVDRLFCWPDAETAVTEARRALAAGVGQDGEQSQ